MFFSGLQTGKNRLCLGEGYGSYTYVGMIPETDFSAQDEYVLS